MLVSHQHRFLFIHVPKTAGTSIEHALQPLSDTPDQRRASRTLSRLGVPVAWRPIRWRNGRKHTTALEMRHLFTRRVFDKYFKFAFVRNPWDYMVSYYHFLSTNPEHHRFAEIRKLESFSDYLKYEMRRGEVSQSRILCDEAGNLLVDYIGRFETLEEDFLRICSLLGISARLEHLNRSEHGDYRSYYDDETARWVAEYCAEDILRFGYEFDQPSAVES